MKKTALLENGESHDFDHFERNGDDVLFFREGIGLVGAAHISNIKNQEILNDSNIGEDEAGS